MRRTRTLAPALVGALLLAACSTTAASAPRPQATHTPTSSRPPTALRSATQATATSTPTSLAAAAALRHANTKIARLTNGLGHRGVSIAALVTDTGATFDYGARHGMLCASIAKLDILETLLLQHERSGHPLGADRRTLATEMIEHSDNDAANDLYVDIGEGSGLRHAAAALGVRNTNPGSGIYWGFTRTGASGYLALLRDLVGRGPLDHASRHYALHLLSHVEADQQWGVGSVADSGTTFYLKNGWLAVSTDADRWAVNTVGIATVHGHRVLMVVMTQHGAGFGSGVELVDHLAHIVARTVIREE